MKKKIFTKWALSLALSCFTLFAVSAANIYVSSGGSDDTGDGTQGNPVLTLGKAYELINNATGTIYVSGEIDGYTAGGNSNTDAICPFLGTSYTLTIQGVGGTNPKIVGDNGATRMFRLRSDMGLVLKDLTLSGTTDATASIDGVCILMGGGWLETDNCVFENFRNNNNGAVITTTNISAAKPLVAVTNCIFRNNSAGAAGYGSVIRVNDVAISDAKFYFENCAILNNDALYGTFFFRQATAVATNPEYTFVNSTFTGNTNSNGNAGSITAYSAPLTLNIINCTVKDNPTNGSVRLTAAATVNIRNSVLENNHGNDLNCDNGPVVTVKNSLILAKRNVSDDVYLKPANYTAAGQLLNAFDASTNSFTPKFGSLAIGYGDAQYLENLGTDGATTIDYDQLGNPRSFAEGKVDCGAVEVGESAIYVSESGSDDTGDGTQGNPVLTLSKAFSYFAANQTGKIYVSGTVAANTTVNGLDLNGINLTVQGVSGTNATVTGDSIRIFYTRANALLTLKDLHLSGNSAKSLSNHGGCIYIFQGAGVSAENCTFENFSTTGTNIGGGVILVSNTSSANLKILSFKNCKFKNNSAKGDWGGGVIRVQDFGAVTDPEVYFENCGFFGNASEGNPGGSVIVLRNGQATSSRMTFINSTITGCGTGGSGAVAVAAAQTLNLIHSTIKDNPVSGVICWEQDKVRFNIYNSVIENNTGTNMQDMRFSEVKVTGGDNITPNGNTIAVFDVKNSLIGNFSVRNIGNTTGGYGDGVIPYIKPTEYTVNTLFKPLDAESISFTPTEGSLAIDYGDAKYLTALNINYDQIGNERLFINNLCDAGSIETLKKSPTSIPDSKIASFNVWSNGNQIVVQTKAAMVYVFNTVGQQVFAEKLTTDNATLNHTFAQGIYLVKVGNQTSKIVIK